MNVTLSDLVMQAYNVLDYQIGGMPEWGKPAGDRFAITAKAEGTGTPAPSQIRLMLQTLLADRFHLKLRRESRELAVYELVVGKDGPKVKETSADAKPARNEGKFTPTMRGPMEFLRFQIASFVDRPVLDKTGLTAREYEFNWDQREMWREIGLGEPRPVPSIFKAVQEQLGMKLEGRKVPIEFLVIEHAERPSEN